MRHKIRLTETDIHRIIKESVNKILNEGWFSRQTNGTVDNFTKDINTLYNIVTNDKIKNYIANFFFVNTNNNNGIIPCKYDERSMCTLLYFLCENNIITVNEKGIDMWNSNYPKIAKLIRPYINAAMCKDVSKNFLNWQ